MCRIPSHKLSPDIPNFLVLPHSSKVTLAACAYCSISKTVTTVYKFLHTLVTSVNILASLHVHLSPNRITCSSNVPFFSTTIYTSKKHFGHSLYLMDQECGMVSQEPCTLQPLLVPSESNSKCISLPKTSHLKFPSMV